MPNGERRLRPPRLKTERKMPNPDREARLQHVKVRGRIAYRVVINSSEIEGVVTWDGEEKALRNFEEDSLRIELFEPFRTTALPMEYSGLLIRYRHSKVMEIRWDKSGLFKVLRYEPGDWERILFDWPEPVPFE
jgi:hypothetical protein